MAASGLWQHKSVHLFHEAHHIKHEWACINHKILRLGMVYGTLLNLPYPGSVEVPVAMNHDNTPSTIVLVCITSC